MTSSPYHHHDHHHHVVFFLALAHSSAAGFRRVLVPPFHPSPLNNRTKKLDGETPMNRPSDDDAPFSALAFKIMSDPFVGTLTFTRIYSGVLEAGTVVFNSVKVSGWEGWWVGTIPDEGTNVASRGRPGEGG